MMLTDCSKCHKIRLNHGGFYIDSPKWIKNKEATKNPKNSDKKCFQYTITAPLNHEKSSRFKKNKKY